MTEQEKDFKDVHVDLVTKGDRVATHFTYWFAWFWGIVSAVYFFAVTFLPIPPAGENFANYRNSGLFPGTIIHVSPDSSISIEYEDGGVESSVDDYGLTLLS